YPAILIHSKCFIPLLPLRLPLRCTHLIQFLLQVCLLLFQHRNDGGHLPVLQSLLSRFPYSVPRGRVAVRLTVRVLSRRLSADSKESGRPHVGRESLGRRATVPGRSD